MLYVTCMYISIRMWCQKEKGYYISYITFEREIKYTEYNVNWVIINAISFLWTNPKKGWRSFYYVPTFTTGKSREKFISRDWVVRDNER